MIAYWLHNRTLPEIAKFYASSPNCLRTLFREADVLTRHSTWSAERRREYQLSICDRFELPRARAREIRYDLYPDALESSMVREYVEFQVPVDAVALYHTVSPMTVWRVLKRHNIPTRPRGRRPKEIATNG